MCYSPDGKKIAFTEMVDGNENIYIINALEGSAIQQITTSSANEMGPQYSVDGSKLFFTKEEVSLVNAIPISRYYIWSFDLQTSLFTQYTEGFTPSLLPDGKNLIITRNNKTTSLGEIWMINIDKGFETLLLSDKDKGFSSPQVSPDGKYVVCVGSTNASENKPANLDLYLFKIDGTGLTQLTFHPGNDVSPKWAPDGKSIFFLSQRGTEKGNWNVWQMSAPQFDQK
jgi:Tol biopolymer transport system component